MEQLLFLGLKVAFLPLFFTWHKVCFKYGMKEVNLLKSAPIRLKVGMEVIMFFWTIDRLSFVDGWHVVLSSRSSGCVSRRSAYESGRHAAIRKFGKSLYRMNKEGGSTFWRITILEQSSLPLV